MDGFSNTDSNSAKRKGMYREQEIAKSRVIQEREKTELKKQIQQQIRSESAALCAEDNRKYTNLVTHSPHVMAPKREYPVQTGNSPTSRLDPAASPSNQSVNQYYRSRPIWKFKEKDFGTFKIC
jgi:hypothetical protein